MDINQYPAKAYDIHSTHLAAEKISCAFKRHKTSPYFAFNVSLFTTGDDVRQTHLKKQLTLFKQSHVLTKEIACREEAIGLAWIAAASGDIDVIVQLVRHAANLNTIGQGCTPSWVAAQNGHANVIVELGKAGADLNLPTEDGETPAWIAARNGHSNGIRTLVDDPNEQVIANVDAFIEHRIKAGDGADAISMTCYDIACILGYADIIQLLKDVNEKASSRAAKEPPSAQQKKIIAEIGEDNSDNDSARTAPPF